MKPFIHVFAVVIFLFMACEKEVTNLPLPNGEAKLVVFGYLTPEDSLISIRVTKSLPFFGDQSKGSMDAVNDAIVILKGEGLSKQLMYDEVLQTYVITAVNFPIHKGGTYFLSVSAPGGFEVEATTTVPNAAIQTLEVIVDSSLQSNFGFEEWKYRVVTKWTDLKGVKNYYRIHLGAVDPGNGEVSFHFCNRMIDDTDQDGEVISNRCESSGKGDFYGSIGPNDQVFLLNADESYYRFHESYFRYNDDNPFGEPVQLYTNVKNGLGCFGSYVTTTTRVIK
jgi:hypothetical protein